MDNVSILLISRDLALIATLQSLLESSGASLNCVTSGDEAVSVVTGQGFAVVLIDVQQPADLGHASATAAQLRQHEHFGSTPLLFLIGPDVNPAEVVQGNVAGTVDYMIKPVVPESFLARLSLFTELFRKTYLLQQQIEEIGRLNLYISERTRAAHEDLNPWHKTALSSIGDGVLATDKQGRVSYLNPVAEKMTGWSAAEAIGSDAHRVFNIVNEHTRQPVSSPIEKVLREGVVVGLANHTVLLGRDGSEIPIDDSGAPIRDASGNIYGAILVFRDVSDLKRLTQLQSQLASIIVSSDDAIISKDLNGIVTSWNKGAEQMYGYTADEIIGKSVSVLSPPELANDVPNILDRIKRGERIVHYETKRVTKDGRVLDVWLTISPIYDDDGNIIGASKIARNITDQKQLQSIQAHLAAIVESSDDAIIGKDLNGIITSWNKGAEQMYGYTADEVIGKSVSLLTPPELANDMPSILERIKRGERVIHYETKRVTKDGTVLDVSLTVSPIHDSHGNIVGASKIARNITEKIQAEAALLEVATFYRKLEEQLSLLVAASGTVLSTLEPEVVLSTALSLAQTLVSANAYGVWRYFPATNDWRMVAATGLSAAFQTAALESYENALARDVPILASDIETIPALANRLEAYHSEGIRALLVIPLLIHGEVCGSIVFYYHEPRQFDELEVRVATALSNIVAAAIGSAELYAQQSQLRLQAQQAEQRAAFLAEASRILGSSLDYHVVLQDLAELVIPMLGDWCAVDVPDENGKLQQIAVAHPNPEKVELAYELRQHFPSEADPNSSIISVLKTGKASLVPLITDEMLVAAIPDADHLSIVRQIDLRSLMIVPLTARGQTVGVLSLGMSESDRHYTPADLTLAEELAHRAGIVVDNARLFREAQEAIRGRDEFLSVAAHELKTPITSLRGFAQSTLRQLEKTHEVDEARLNRALQAVNDQSIKLGYLVSQLLDLSRFEAGKLSLEKSDTDITSLIEELATQAQAATTKHTIRVKSKPHEMAFVDKIRLEQVITNLIDNAVKYSPNGGPVTVDVTPADNDTLRIAVTDQGLGIPIDRRARIFERFYQAHPGEYFGGLGLGLYISRQIVELHGGTITAEFPRAGGTCFVVTIPRHMESG